MIKKVFLSFALFLNLSSLGQATSVLPDHDGSRTTSSPVASTASSEREIDPDSLSEDELIPPPLRPSEEAQVILGLPLCFNADKSQADRFKLLPTLKRLGCLDYHGYISPEAWGIFYENAKINHSQNKEVLIPMFIFNYTNS